ncbi:Lrp/AsnC family transcriptional regulator [Leucobacter sp.]
MTIPQDGQPVLDDLDYAVVEALSREPGLSNRGLADRLGIAESTCAYRVRRLRDAAVIGPRRLDLDYARLGYALRAVVLVFLARHSREVVDEFMAHMVQQPNVLNVMNLTGRYDFMVTVAVAGTEELRRFVLDHVTVLPSVRGTETHIVFSVENGEWIPGAPGR